MTQCSLVDRYQCFKKPVTSIQGYPCFSITLVTVHQLQDVTLFVPKLKSTHTLSKLFFKDSPIKSESAIAELGPRMFVFNQIWLVHMVTYFAKRNNIHIKCPKGYLGFSDLLCYMVVCSQIKFFRIAT